MDRTPENFIPALRTFIEGCKTRSPIPKEWEVRVGSRYVKIIRDHSVHCFVDVATGDVLKPATFKAPAKHARGNIFDEHNGLGSMGPYGPAYLR